MLIRLFANRDAIQRKDQDKIWILAIPGKTIYARTVVIDAVGSTVYNENPEVKPNAYLEFDADLRKGDEGEYAIVPVNDGMPKRL